MQALAEEKRILLIDIARFYAIALVFYGHLIERFAMLQNPAGAIQYKFVYSFHMVLFLYWPATWQERATWSSALESI